MTRMLDLVVIIAVLLVLLFLRSRHGNLWKRFRRRLHDTLGSNGHWHQAHDKRDQMTEDLNARDLEEKKF